MREGGGAAGRLHWRGDREPHYADREAPANAGSGGCRRQRRTSFGLVDLPRDALLNPRTRMTVAVTNEIARSARAQSRANLLENYFYFFMAVLIGAVVVYGFSQTVEGKLFHPPEARPFLLYVHAAVFFGWVVFFILQSVLVRIRNVSWHRRLGWFGVGLGIAMFILGVSTAITMARFDKFSLHVAHPERGLLISLYDITAFAIPFSLGIYWRRRPEFHRRLQLLSCSALTAAAFGRFVPFFLTSGGRHSPALLAFASWTTLYAGVDILILCGMARDLVFLRRIHPVYLYGFSAFVVCQGLILYTLAHHSVWWMKAAGAILG